jgi:hypothetical protein
MCCALAAAVAFGLVVTRPALAHVRLNAPNGGEVLDAGSVFTLEWNILISHNLQNWDLWYSTTSNTGPWIDIAMDLSPGSGAVGSVHTFDWTIPNIASAQTWARVRMDNAATDYYDVSNASFMIVPDSPSADFNGDGLVDCIDVDSLVMEIVAENHDPAFDLTGDGVVDTADLDEWRVLGGAANLPSGNPYLVGDAGLDGVVDGLDFIEWNSHKFTNLAAWCNGDFNADGVVDGLDFILWNENKFSSSDGVSAVPEPGTTVLLWVMLLVSLSGTGRRG